MDARELETWFELWQQYGFGERREDLRWARLCLIATQDETKTLADYLDWIDGDIAEIEDRRQRTLEANLAMHMAMNNRAQDNTNGN